MNAMQKYSNEDAIAKQAKNYFKKLDSKGKESILTQKVKLFEEMTHMERFQHKIDLAEAQIQNKKAVIERVLD